MESKSFVYWLQGYFEISQSNQGLTAEQVDIIKRHLSMVFIHEIDPAMGGPEHQKALNKAHVAKPKTIDGIDVSHMLVGSDPLIRC